MRDNRVSGTSQLTLALVSFPPRSAANNSRADVLASAHDGNRRVAFEAQLSPITDDDITERTDHYQADGINVCWVTTGSWPPWMGIVPSIRIQEPNVEQPWTVGEDVARFDYTVGAWCIVSVGLTQFISWVLHEKVLVHPVRRRYRWIWLLSLVGC